MNPVLLNAIKIAEVNDLVAIGMLEQFASEPHSPRDRDDLLYATDRVRALIWKKRPKKKRAKRKDVV